MQAAEVVVKVVKDHHVTIWRRESFPKRKENDNVSMALLIISVVSGALLLISFLVGRRKLTKRWNRISYATAVISCLAIITSGVLSYWTSIETKSQLQLTRDQVNESQAQIVEIRTPRRMEPETRRMLVARVRPYVGQKYDMQVFRDQDSLELASAIQSILEEAGWLYTNVYPKYATTYPETRDDGLFIISGIEESRRTSKAKTALEGALNEAGLYDDSTVLTPVSCVESIAPIQEGSKLTEIPCSESPIQITGVDFTVRDGVIPEDTLVLHIGKKRL